MTEQQCSQVQDDLAALVDGEAEAIARHADHLASCDDCRDARHEAAQLAKSLAVAGHDYVPTGDLAAKILATLEKQPTPQVDPTAETLKASTLAIEKATRELAKPAATPADKKRVDAPTPITSRKTAPKRIVWIAAGAAALAAGTVGYVALKKSGSQATQTTGESSPVAIDPAAPVGTVAHVERAAADKVDGVSVVTAAGTKPLKVNEPIPAGAELRTDDRTRVSLAFADGTKITLDHSTSIKLGAKEPRQITMTTGRLVADVAHVEQRPASITTPNGRIDVVGTRFAVAAADTLTSVQVVRGAIILNTTAGAKQEVRAGEEGTIDKGVLAVNAAPGAARDVEWSELGTKPVAQSDEVTSGLGALRAYKPGEKRDRDWNLALAKHDVKVRIVGPIARTEITETFRNDSDAVLEGVYQFPLPADAQIDGLQLDVKDGFETGAFVDKERAAKIWRGVIEKATPKMKRRPSEDIIWVQGPWRDPALLDWKRGGRFELKIFPIPAKGSRTIKISYTQVVTPRGPWRQYTYPLPHSADGSTVADEMNIDVEVRGAEKGGFRAPTYDLVADPKRADVEAHTFHAKGFVPRGDLVVDYRAAEGDAEMRAWTFAGGHAMAPDEKLAARKNVGNEEAVLVAQRAAAADVRPTAVIALKPKLPKWDASKPRDYVIAVDTSQSMTGERATRAGKLVDSLVGQLDRRDRFTVLACDTECRSAGALEAPTAANLKDTASWLASQTAAGASDIVSSVRSAAAEMKTDAQRERWVIYIGDGFTTTGFRRQADVEKAIAASTDGVRVATIGIGGDADSTVLAAVARGGGGSFIPYRPGESISTAAQVAIASTLGSALRDATVELPPGLADVAPTILPTIRGGEEVLVAARVTGEVKGDIVVRGSVAGQPFEQRYPLALAVSSAPGNGFVPRLWASLAIEQLERAGTNGDRARIVALSQGYGVMSRETSLLVLESAEMFEAFGVDRREASDLWTGEESIDEVTASGTISQDPAMAGGLLGDADAPASDSAAGPPAPATVASRAPKKAPAPEPKDKESAKAERADRRGDIAMDDEWGGSRGRGGRAGMIAMRKVWYKVPSISTFDGTSPNITKAIATAEAALAAQPDSREKHRALVQALSYAGEIERAQTVAAQWLERDRLDPQALGYQADLIGRTGDRETALRVLSGLIDLNADGVPMHERMVRAYEQAGRLAQACSHRIALASIQTKDPKAAGQAVRCLRSLGRQADSELVLSALPDAAARSAAEKAATSPAPAAAASRDLSITGTWSGGEDLDITLVAPDGSRISWMGGRADATASDVTSSSTEKLGLRTLKKGNYLVEVTRKDGGRMTRGTVEITAIGAKKSIPFEMSGTRTVVARVNIGMQFRLERVMR